MDLDDDCLKLLFDARIQGKDGRKLPLRLVCKRWANLIEPGKGGGMKNALMQAAADNSKKMCLWACRKNFDYDTMFIGAASGGHIDLMNHISDQRWFSMSQETLQKAIRVAAREGHTKTCLGILDELKKYKYYNNYGITMEMFVGAAEGGHIELFFVDLPGDMYRRGGTVLNEFYITPITFYHVAKNNHNDLIDNFKRASFFVSQSDYEEMLRGGAEGGHLDVCYQAKAGGAGNWNEMLTGGASANNEEICKLAIEWGAYRTSQAMIYAIEHENENICKLIMRQNETNITSDLLASWSIVTQEDALLILSANRGKEKLCRLAKDWGATAFNSMLDRATMKGHRRLCELAREWGANNFDRMGKKAARKKNFELCQLAYEWGGRGFAEDIIINFERNILFLLKILTTEQLDLIRALGGQSLITQRRIFRMGVTFFIPTLFIIFVWSILEHKR